MSPSKIHTHCLARAMYASLFTPLSSTTDLDGSLKPAKPSLCKSESASDVVKNQCALLVPQSVQYRRNHRLDRDLADEVAEAAAVDGVRDEGEAGRDFHHEMSLCVAVKSSLSCATAIAA